MRPLLNPALRRAWRDVDTVQIGVDPARAVVIGGLDPGCARFVDSLDGTLDEEAALARADRWGLDRARARDLLRLLAAAGVVADAGGDPGNDPGGRPGWSRVDRAERERLAPDLASAALVYGDGRSVLARRRRAALAVRGLGRLGTLVSVLLGCAGVGRVVPEDLRRLRRADLSPAGPDAAAVGRQREDAVQSLLGRVTPATRTVSTKGRRDPDLVVVADPGPGRATYLDELTRRGTPHLLVDVRETTGIVGPFVVPGRTACQRCQDLHRADRDPDWPRVVAQLAAPPAARAPTEPCDAVLAAAVAAQAALHVLLWVDTSGGALPPSANGTVEVALPHGRVRRRSWPAHPACGCAWARAG